MSSYTETKEKKKLSYQEKYFQKDSSLQKNVNGGMHKKNACSKISKKFEKKDYSNREIMISFINKKNPSFFEQFDIFEFISSGSVGYVYRGMFKSNKGQIALKFLINKKRKEMKKKKEKKNFEKQILKEIQISKMLHNKNIIEIYGYFKINENYNISVLELGKCGDLENFSKKIIKRRFLPESVLNFFAKQILEALQYIHKCKIIHMDIKPRNILVDSDLNIKLTDFSVSLPYSTFNLENSIEFPLAGTGKFMAPEIISKTHIKIKECEKIDIYSFGSTLYYLFYGDYPYKLNDLKNKDYENILKNIENEKLIFPQNRKISALFKDFLIKILKKDYTKRLNIRQALNHPWIQGAQIIFDEKENICNLENFLIRLTTDNIPKFNEYIKLKK